MLNLIFLQSENAAQITSVVEEGAVDVNAVADANETLSAEGLVQNEEPRQGMGGWSMWIWMLLIFVVFYFFMIRPQTKKQKELQKQRDALKKGDKVVTAGGIYGEIKEIQENAFIITIAKEITIKVDKGSVYAVEENKEAAKDDKK